MKLLKEKYILNLILAAVLIRLLIIPFFYHPDIKTYHFQASFLQQGVWDIYSFIPENRGELSLKEEFVYFPLTYFTLGFYQAVAKPFLGPDFYNWLNNASASSVEMTGIFRYLFILKLPYLFLDILVGLLIVKIFKEREDKKRALLLWLFNPFTIIILYVYSNVDIFPVFLSVLSLLFAKSNKFALAGFMIGLGAAFKIYPLLFLPFLILFADNWKDRVLVSVSAILSFVLILLPFITSPGFQLASVNSGLTNRIFNGIPIGYGLSIYPALILISAALIFAAARKMTFERLLGFYFLIIASILISIHFHIQWLLWFAPFVVILATIKRKWIILFIVFGILGIIIPFFYNDPSMTVSTLSVINPLFSSVHTPYTVSQKLFSAEKIINILHILFFGSGLIIFWRILKERIG